VVGLVALVALAFAWTPPPVAGDLRPSPDAVEYGLGAADLAAARPPRIRIDGVSAPSRYPFGFPLLAAPFVRVASGTGEPRPEAAVLACAAAGAVLALAVTLTGWRAFGGRWGLAAGVAGALLTVASPFFATYTRLVMAEVPTAALFALVALGLVTVAGRPAGGAGRWPVAIGLLLALAVTVRLSNLTALPAAVAGLLVAAPGRRWAALGRSGVAFAAGLVPLLLANWLTFGAPLTTGYHLWTPEWTGGSRPQFALAHALARPALPAGAAQGNLAHYGAAWLGLPAPGDGGTPTGSPVHPTAAGLLALGAVLGVLRAGTRPRPVGGRPVGGRPVGGVDGSPASRALVVYVVGGLLGAGLFYGLYYYQDVRFLAPWAPLYLLLAAAGWLWPRWRPVLLAGVAALAIAFVPLPATLGGAPLWEARVRGRPPEAPPRLAQMEALARDLPPDAWIVSAIDGPLLDHHVLRGTSRRYVPLARGLEFVDKPPFRAVPAAPDLTEALAVRVASGVPDAVVIDRWSLELAEGLPDYRRELERLLAPFDLAPGGAEAPRRPGYYRLVSRTPGDGALSVARRFGLEEGEALRDSAGRVYLYRGGQRRHVPDLESFRALGLRWEAVRRLPDAVLEALPEGPPASPP
jgi:hypothetical protein